MIGHPLHSDESSLRSIWREIFHDSEEFVDLFFRKMYSEESTLVYRSGSEIAGMVFFPEYEFKFGSKRSNLGYMCGAATLPEFRNKGIMGQMINHSVEIMKERGYGYAALIPASDSLYGYYERFGFHDFFFKKRYTAKRSDSLTGSPFSFERLSDFGRLFDTYKASVSRLNAVVLQSEKSYRTAIEDLGLSGGVVLTSANRDLFCFAISEGSVVYLKEMFCCRPHYDPYPDLVISLFKHFPEAETIIAEGPVESIKSDSVPFRTGMIKALSDENNPAGPGYMNFMLE